MYKERLKPRQTGNTKMGVWCFRLRHSSFIQIND